MQDNQRGLTKIPEELENLTPVPSHSNGNYQGYFDAEAGEENHFKEYLRSVRKHLWLVIGLTLVVTAVAALYQVRQPDVFSAHARVQVDLENNPATGSSKNGTIVINSPTSDPAYFNTQLENLGSLGLLRRVVKTLDLEHNQAFLQPLRQQRSLGQSLLRIIGKDNKTESQPKPDYQLRLTKLAPASSRDDLEEAQRLEPFVNRLQTKLKVDPVKQTRSVTATRDTRLIDVTLEYGDPQLAAKIVNVIADTFVASNLEKKTETNASAGNFLQTRVAELQSQIRSGEERLMNYARDHQIVSLDGIRTPWSSDWPD